jgi:hypothetical protein
MDNTENAARDRERITAVLTPKATADLARLVKRTGLSKTSLVNRGISLCELVDRQVAAGAEVLIRLPDGTVREVMFL